MAEKTVNDAKIYVIGFTNVERPPRVTISIVSLKLVVVIPAKNPERTEVSNRKLPV